MKKKILQDRFPIEFVNDSSAVAVSGKKIFESCGMGLELLEKNGVYATLNNRVIALFPDAAIWKI